MALTELRLEAHGAVHRRVPEKLPNMDGSVVSYFHVGCCQGSIRPSMPPSIVPIHVESLASEWIVRCRLPRRSLKGRCMQGFVSEEAFL